MQQFASPLLWIFGLVVLAEALNKLERTRPCLPGLTANGRLLAWLKALAWALLALAGAGALVAPIFDPRPPSTRELCMFAGFVVLIVRTRFKEG
ncbi:hypothetical protein [Delftia sp. PS-11]|uniref:hypothetical protein n=1 Tax=Delftia sp. PS-11 TaxID=2767222 RepID=UPI002455EA0B|nr:hypothetical protein [Delftia sp. PS-11]KAJ8745426.1 hypothetical protein H9T68_06400 [Delftia sp. PS-11]